MGFSTRTQKMLWGRAAGKCSMPKCRIQLYIDGNETDDMALIGENCHIVADKEGGPRGENPLHYDQREKYENLILLCRNHHREIDQQIAKYTIEKLHKIKISHEKWVRERLQEFDPAKQKDDEYYAGLVDEWASTSNLDYWLAWSSFVLSGGEPQMAVEMDEKLKHLRRWLLNRVWPGRYPNLEKALHNFRYVLQDFHELFREHAELPYDDSEWLTTRKFYKITQWEPEEYRRLLNRYEYHVDLVQDLMLELTRAANLICDEVRVAIFPGFRLDEGRLVVQSGPHMDRNLGLATSEYVVQYSQAERSTDHIYPGLERFKSLRADRDVSYGKD